MPRHYPRLLWSMGLGILLSLRDYYRNRNGIKVTARIVDHREHLGQDDMTEYQPLVEFFDQHGNL